jgi:hypothetical protein
VSNYRELAYRKWSAMRDEPIHFSSYPIMICCIDADDHYTESALVKG